MTLLTPFKLTPLGLVAALAGLTGETLTRVPPSRPWVNGPEAPVFRVIYSLLIVRFLVGVTLQVRG